MSHHKLPLPENYDFAQLLALLSRFQAPATFAIAENTYWRVMVQPQGKALVGVTASETALQAETIAQQGTIDANLMLKNLAHVLGTDIPTQAFFERAQDHATLWETIESVHGLPIFCTETLYEALIFSIIEQHISWVAAQKAQRWLVEWGGVFIEHDGVRHYAMPPPQKLATASQHDLKPLKITFKRMQLLIDISQKIVKGELALDEWATQTPEELYKSLLSIKGVGHWTAANVVHRATGVYPYVLDNDVALQRAMNRYFFGEDSRASREVVVETFAQFGEDAGLAAHYTLMRYVMDEY